MSFRVCSSSYPMEFNSLLCAAKLAVFYKTTEQKTLKINFGAKKAGIICHIFDEMSDDIGKKVYLCTVLYDYSKSYVYEKNCFVDAVLHVDG